MGQATFTAEAQLQQHLSGPVHKKAAEKAAREAAKQEHLSQYSAVAEAAVQAAAWQENKAVIPLGRHRNLHQQALPAGQQQQRQHHKQQRPRDKSEQFPQQQPTLTHEQVLAEIRHAEPLSLDGEGPRLRQQRRRASCREELILPVCAVVRDRKN